MSEERKLSKQTGEAAEEPRNPKKRTRTASTSRETTEKPTKKKSTLTKEAGSLEVDVENMTASLLPSKVKAYAQCIHTNLQKNSITLTELKSMIGKLQYSIVVIRCGRAFLRRLHDLTTGKFIGERNVTLNQSVKEDLKTWLCFLENYNGITIIRKKIGATSNTMNLYSDASLTGYGATFGSSYITGIFPRHWDKYSITVLET